MRIELTRRAERDLKKLDRPVAKRVVDALKDLEEGRRFLEPLSGQFKGLFKLRVGDYRIITQPQKPGTIIVRFIRHRSKAY